MAAIKQALISVSDKSGVLEFAQGLNQLGVKILSTGGTAKLLASNGIPVTEVAEYTGFPEMLDGRVKTLQPKIHAGILARRDLPEHATTLAKHNIPTIDLVVVNLYPFGKVITQKEIKKQEAIDRVLILCPAGLIKNWQNELRGCFRLEFEVLGIDFNDFAPASWENHNRVIASFSSRGPIVMAC